MVTPPTPSLLSFSPCNYPPFLVFLYCTYVPIHIIHNVLVHHSALQSSSSNRRKELSSFFILIKNKKHFTYHSSYNSKIDDKFSKKIRSSFVPFLPPARSLVSFRSCALTKISLFSFSCFFTTVRGWMDEPVKHFLSNFCSCVNKHTPPRYGEFKPLYASDN